MEAKINMLQTFLSFKLGKEIFAIDVNNVIEVVENTGVTPVPKTADYIEGVINFRGDILSVISAEKKLKVPRSEGSIQKVIIVLEFEQKKQINKVGMIADKVFNVIKMASSEIHPVLEFGNYYNPDFLKGAFKLKENIITILNLEKILSEDDISIIKENHKIN